MIMIKRRTRYTKNKGLKRPNTYKRECERRKRQINEGKLKLANGLIK